MTGQSGVKGRVAAFQTVYGSGGKVQCTLCHHGCVLAEGRIGRCGVRKNDAGQLVSLVYGRLVAEHVDPIEKKPFFHVLPGTLSYSIATVGCNFSCLHCQNSSISQVSRIGEEVGMAGRQRGPEDVVLAARASGAASISYTYVEPTVFYEFAADCCHLAKTYGLLNLFVSNGYMSGKALENLAQVLDGINIDLKGFSDDFYRRICGARLEPVLENIRHAVQLGIWVEVTTLIIPDHNDSLHELTQLAEFLVDVDPDLVWHVTGFHPSYRMQDRLPTAAESLFRARKIGLDAGLRYVYTGNRPGGVGENTGCANCGGELLERNGFSLRRNRLVGDSCPDCGTPVAGIWKVED